MDAAKLVSHSFKYRPQQALQLAIWWVEHVAHTGGDPLLKSSAVELPRFVYYSLDCYVVVGLILAMVIGSWIALIRRCCGKQSDKKNKRD